MVENVNETVDFYNKILGFKITMTVPETGQYDWAMVAHGNTTLMFQAKKNILEEYPVLSNQSVGGGLTFFLEVENIDKIYNQLKDNTKCVKELHVTLYGMKEFAIQDCNGFVLTFAERQA